MSAHVIPFPDRRPLAERAEAVVLSHGAEVHAAAERAPGPALNLPEVQAAIDAAELVEVTTRSFAALETLATLIADAPRVELESGATFAVVPIITNRKETL